MWLQTNEGVTSANFTCATGYTNIVNTGSIAQNYTMTCTDKGDWVPVEHSSSTICGTCCDLGDVSADSGCNGNKWYHSNNRCMECKPTQPLALIDYVQLFGIFVFGVLVVFLLADLLKQLGTVMGPIMSLLTFLQMTYLQYSLSEQDCVFTDFLEMNFLCKDGALGASNLDTSFLNKWSWVGEVMKSADPHCAFNFKYDTEWFLVVTSPLMVTLFMAGGLLVWIGLAVVCNWWLPPASRSEVHIPLPGRKRDVARGEGGCACVRRDRDEQKQPVGSYFITLLLFWLWFPIWIMWWLVWGFFMVGGHVKALLFCCGLGPGKMGDEQFPDLHLDGIEWRAPGKILGLEKIMARFARVDAIALSNTALGVLLVYVWGAYVFILKTSLGPLFCDGASFLHPTGVMLTRASIVCDTSHEDQNGLDLVNYSTLRICALVSSTIYGIGIPWVFYWVLSHAKVEIRREEGGLPRSRLKDRDFTDRYGFITTKMREQTPCYYWDVIILGRKGILAVLTEVFSSKVTTYYTLSLVIVMLFGFLQQLYLPFALPDGNFVESMTLVSSALLLVLALAKEQVDSSQYWFSKLMDDGILLVVFATIAGTVLVIIRHMFGALWLVNKVRSKNAKKAKAEPEIRDQTAQQLAIENYTKVKQEYPATCLAVCGKDGDGMNLEATPLRNSGWAAKELKNHERDMIDKSNLLLADTWAETESSRADVAECKLVLHQLRNFSAALSGNAAQRYRESQQFADHFKEELRPVMFAWVASQYIIETEIEHAERDKAAAEGLPDTDARAEMAFLTKHIDRLQQSLDRHREERKMRNKFVNNLRKTDEKQKWYVCKKLCMVTSWMTCKRQCFACKCCVSERCPNWYANFVEAVSHDGDGPVHELDFGFSRRQAKDGRGSGTGVGGYGSVKLRRTGGGASPMPRAQPPPPRQPQPQSQVSRPASPVGGAAQSLAARAGSVAAAVSRPVSPDIGLQASLLPANGSDSATEPVSARLSTTERLVENDDDDDAW